ncbi:hypothetical protein ANN_27135 [Periplaneta americana]|uniref:Uncharacterized protein n=1 Tax=Periplaneta americana TaxID=6978 RepID=A0ABQ8RX78_PERAM|nr:hypothetical protein ANN_27135 [Periplaneta americana]
MMSWHGACASGTARVLSVASLHWLKMDVPIPAPAEFEVRSVIKFLNAQGIAPIEIDRQLCQVTCPNQDLNPGSLVSWPGMLIFTPQQWTTIEEVEKFKYLGARVTNINDTREEIKHRINMGNACYYSVEKLLSSSLLSKNLKVRIDKTVRPTLPVVLYGCETWTLTLREEQRLRVFENKVLRKIFGAKRDEVTGEWRKLHNTELHALYSSPDIIRNIKSRRLRWAGHVARMGEFRNAYRVLVGRPEGKRPLGRPRRRREDNIKIDSREVGYDDRDWINLAQNRDQWRAYVMAAMNLRCRLSRPESIDVDSFSGLRGRGLLVGFIPDVSSATAADIFSAEVARLFSAYLRQLILCRKKLASLLYETTHPA